MKINRKIFSLVLAVCVSSSFYVPAYAAETTNELKTGKSPVSERVSEILNNNPTTQEMVISERELIDNMIAEGKITRGELNEQLMMLAGQSENDLLIAGYNEQQISAIKSYEKGEDAYDYIYNPNVSTRGTADAEVTFKYGLALDSNQRQVTIAYDMTWSENPFWTFTDSFGVGWVAADKDSEYLATKIDSSIAGVDYFTTDAVEEPAGLYRDVEMDTFSNRAVVGNPILGSANGNYGKHISGITEVSTQSDSYNLETIQVFVAYAHTMLTFKPSWDISLNVNVTETSISFSIKPDMEQEMMAKGNHTFHYDDRYDWEAEKTDG